MARLCWIWQIMVVVLEADLGKSTKSLHFRKAHPERTVSCGIGEQNMLLATGLATSGYIPFASTFAIFTERAFEQMRNGVARPNGCPSVWQSRWNSYRNRWFFCSIYRRFSHFRTLPNVIVMHPCDDVSTRVLTNQLVDTNQPSYL